MAFEVPYNRIFSRDPNRVARSTPDAMVPVARDKAASEIDIRRKKDGQGIALTRGDFGTGFDQVARGSDVSATKQLINELWKDWTPTFSSFTLGNGTINEARYKIMGPVCFWKCSVTLGSTSVVSGGIIINLPEQPSGVDQATIVGYGLVNDANAAGNRRNVTCFQNGAGFHMLFDGGSISSTTPFTWATGDGIRVAGMYEI